MRLLDRLRPRREFSLPAFELAPLEFAPEQDELLLDEVVAALGEQSASATAALAAPTAGELRQSIERHLHSTQSHEAQPDAAEELRDALIQLRRSIG